MFKLNPSPTFEATVMIPQPGGDPVGLDLVCHHMRRSEFMALTEAIRSGEVSELHALLRLVCGWKNVDAEFSDENLAALMDNYPAAALAIPQAYGLALMRGRTKN